jgi:FkbM family methyltransferase
MYSQNQEEAHILQYFKGDHNITLLDIGANDGKTFSNSLALIERGASAVLVEPSPKAFERLKALHFDRTETVLCLSVAIGNKSGRVTLHESGPHMVHDLSLLSSVSIKETIKWRETVQFEEVEVNMITYPDLQRLCGIKDFDFITIDAEGLDLEILKQIDLTNARLVCVEHNSQPSVAMRIKSHCALFGLNNMLYLSGENILIAR